MALDFEGVLEMLKRNKEQPTIEEEALAQHECPIHMVALKENENGQLSCPFGHIYEGESDW